MRSRSVADWPIVITARLKRGKMVLDRDALKAQLAGARDCQLTVTIERAHATRSAAQNAWYWSQVLKLISEHTGYTVDEVHELMKAKFNAKVMVVTNAAGELVSEDRVGQTTTKLNKLTFGDYCEQIRIWAAQELDVYIPDPDPNWRDESLREAHRAR